MNTAFPESRVLNPESRLGVTLAEVLIAMGILAIGLLGTAAMFPVGGFLMRKGDVADHGAAIAQAAFADLVARDGLNPENWQVWEGGVYQPMGPRMRAWMANNANRPPGDADGAQFQSNMNRDLGFIYVIDPLGTAAGIQTGLDPGELSHAPYDADPTLPPDGVAAVATDAPEWLDFDSRWPVRRMSSSSIDLGGTPSRPVAESLFSSSDDLSIVTDDDADKPRHFRVVGPDANGDQVPDSAISRESKGDYSWLATIAPVQSDAREALALNPSAYYFDVSVVVFYKRPISTIDTSERLVRGRVVSTGTGGGEILLTKLNDGINEDPFKELKEGQWVMVSGPHPTSTPQEPLFFTQWYRVLAIDDQQRGPIVNAEKQRLVGLRGPDWPWVISDPNNPPVVRVGLFPGAVAVHTKTMRLESLGPYSAN